MKRILSAAFGIFVFFEMVMGLSAATYQPTKLGWVDFSLSSATVSEICKSTPTTVGKPKWCTNCAASGGSGTICYSTITTAPGAGCDFVLSTGTQCK